jgi:hypothetical protein
VVKINPFEIAHFFFQELTVVEQLLRYLSSQFFRGLSFLGFTRQGQTVVGVGNFQSYDIIVPEFNPGFNKVALVIDLKNVFVHHAIVLSDQMTLWTEEAIVNSFFDPGWTHIEKPPWHFARLVRICDLNVIAMIYDYFVNIKKYLFGKT